MRCLERNTQTVWYSLYAGRGTRAVDADGLYTGDRAVAYSAPVEALMNVSGARGTAEREQFGINTSYTKTIVTDDMETEFDTDTIFWIGVEPDANGEAGAVKHNYAVVRVSKTLNSVTLALAEVQAS